MEPRPVPLPPGSQEPCCTANIWGRGHSTSCRQWQPRHKRPSWWRRLVYRSADEVLAGREESW